MSTHFIVVVIALWAALAIAGIILFAALIRRINDLGILTRAKTDKLMELVEHARGAQQAQMNELLETRIAVRKEAASWTEFFEAHYKEIEVRLRKYDFDVVLIRDDLEEITKLVDPAETGEIALPDLSAEYEDQFHKEMVDNKDLVCRKLAEFLRYTRAGEDIESITYEKVEENDGFSYEEYAVIKFQNGFTKGVTITGDSGKAIAKDVIASL